MNIKNWTVSPLNKERAAKIAEDYQLPFFLAMLLEIRGIHTQEQIQALLMENPVFCDPFSLADMDKAVERIHRAIENFEKIAIYGDYDADGVTSTAMLYSYLESCGANVMFYIPDREVEGYGMNTKAMDSLKEYGVNLIITVDNGISAVEEVEYAKQCGMDVVITDHHRPQETLPDAVAVVDPYRKDCVCAFPHFAGVGVAFKLISALEGEGADITGLLENYADLVAIGTIGDIVPLTGENRAFVQTGLRLLSRSDRMGIRALLERCSLEGENLSASTVAFRIVPRINATGRIGSSDRAVHLLTCEDMELAGELAVEICDNNDYRRQIENEMVEKALELLAREPDRLYDRVLVVEGEDWHHGVIGIVASRLTDKFGKPCVVISYTADEAKGSGRSVEGFSLFEAICSCAQLFTKFGGHPMAAGLSMPTKHLAAFRKAINDYAASLPMMPVPSVSLDCKLNPAALSVEMPQQVKYLEPFGTDNPAPVFGLYEMRLKEVIPVGGGKHLRLVFQKKNVNITCMKFGMTAQEFPYQTGDFLDLAVTLDNKEFRGQETLSVLIRDMRLSNLDSGALIADDALYQKMKRGESLRIDEQERLFPDRQAFAMVYRLLKARDGWHHHILALLLALQGEGLTLAKLLVALDVMEEKGLIAVTTYGEVTQIQVLPVEQKVDLFDSQILNGLKQAQKGV